MYALSLPLGKTQTQNTDTIMHSFKCQPPPPSSSRKSTQWLTLSQLLLWLRAIHGRGVQNRYWVLGRYWIWVFGFPLLKSNTCPNWYYTDLNTSDSRWDCLKLFFYSNNNILRFREYLFLRWVCLQNMLCSRHPSHQDSLEIGRTPNHVIEGATLLEQRCYRICIHCCYRRRFAIHARRS